MKSKKARVMLNRTIKSSKFNVSIPAWVETNAFTDNYNRWYVEVPGEPLIRLAIDTADIELVKYVQ